MKMKCCEGEEKKIRKEAKIEDSSATDNKSNILTDKNVRYKFLREVTFFFMPLLLLLFSSCAFSVSGRVKKVLISINYN